MVYMHEVDTLVFKFCIKRKLVCSCGVGIKKPCVIIVEVI